MGEATTKKESKVGPAQQVIILWPFVLAFAPSFNCLPALEFDCGALVSAAMDLMHTSISYQPHMYYTQLAHLG